MARGRVIDREFFKHEGLGVTPYEERILFAGMIVFADDAGRVKANPKYLRGSIFPFDDITIQRIAKLRDDLAAKGFIKLYSGPDGSEYLFIPSFKRWQPLRPDRVKPSDCPPPPDMPPGEETPAKSGDKDAKIDVGLSSESQPKQGEPNQTIPNQTIPTTALTEPAPLTPGQKANRVYKIWCEKIYPESNNGEKYHGNGGRDMVTLTKIFKADSAITIEEAVDRLTDYAQDADTFLAKKGHAISSFTWNAYSKEEIRRRANGRTNTSRRGATPDPRNIGDLADQYQDGLSSNPAGKQAGDLQPPHQGHKGKGSRSR